MEDEDMSELYSDRIAKWELYFDKILALVKTKTRKLTEQEKDEVYFEVFGKPFVHN